MIRSISCSQADILIGFEDHASLDYCYGGTRMVPAHFSEELATKELLRLMNDESGVKNALINRAIRFGAVNHLRDRIPAEFFGSRVGGGRCIIWPKTVDVAGVLSDPEHHLFHDTIRPIFRAIGEEVNRLKGRIKLTPDFGRYAGLADLLHDHTEHSLGIRCPDGGCGGKSSYSNTGVVAAFETLGKREDRSAPVTHIGSAGAMGSDFVKYLVANQFTNVTLCDLAFDDSKVEYHRPEGYSIAKAKFGRFTDECLAKGGTIVANTVGRELEHSNWHLIPEGTTFLLAHNLALPDGEAGVQLMRGLHERNVLAIPGQILTLGGAATSRLEWFWRKSRKGQAFDKPLAHEVVAAIVKLLVEETLSDAESRKITPYEAMLRTIDTELLPLKN